MDRLLFIYLIVFGLGVFSCDSFEDGDTNFTDLEFQRESLIRSWVNDDVILDNINVSSEFQGFQLVFNEDNTWTSTNGEPIFLGGGTWDFVPGDLDKINMGNDIVIDIRFTIDRAQGNTMTIFFNTNGRAIGAARAFGLTGDYTMKFSNFE